VYLFAHLPFLFLSYQIRFQLYQQTSVFNHQIHPPILLYFYFYSSLLRNKCEGYSQSLSFLHCRNHLTTYVDLHPPTMFFHLTLSESTNRFSVSTIPTALAPSAQYLFPLLIELPPSRSLDNSDRMESFMFGQESRR